VTPYPGDTKPEKHPKIFETLGDMIASPSFDALRYDPVRFSFEFNDGMIEGMLE